MNVLAILMFQEVTTEPSPVVTTTIIVIWLAILILTIAALWKVFTKAGEPGWAAIIPIYNVIVWLKIAGKPLSWILLFLIPIVNFIIGIIVDISFARNFGRGVGFALGLVFLPFIFIPILAWGDARYAPQPA
jgi:hypothetical protein